MTTHRIDVKVHLEDWQPQSARLIEIFHSWIEERSLDELLIDVADYSHLRRGPGVMLIAHQANYAFDTTDGRPGLLYARKRSGGMCFEDLLEHSLSQARRATRLLSTALSPDAAEIEVAETDLTLRFRDRLLAAEPERAGKAIEPRLRAVLGRFYRPGGILLHRTVEQSGFLCFSAKPRAPVARATGGGR